jgi:hypothetical protein
MNSESVLPVAGLELSLAGIDRFPVVCENSADGLRGLPVIEFEHAAEPLTAPYRARSE